MSLPIRTSRHLRRARKSAGRSAVSDETIIVSKVRITDHDAFGHMTNTRYNGFLRIARKDWLIKTGLDRLLTSENLQMVVAEEGGMFLKALRAPTRFSVVTRCTAHADTHLSFKAKFLRREILCAAFQTKVRLETANHEVINPNDLIARLTVPAE